MSNFADLTVVQSLVWDQLNAAVVAYGTFSDNQFGDPRWQQQAILDWILDADLRIAQTICNSPGNPRRSLYIQAPVSLNNGDLMPLTMIGPPQKIDIHLTGGGIREGVPQALDWLDIANLDPSIFLGTQFTEGYYSLVDNRLKFTGVSADVYFATVTRATGNPLNTPIELTDLLVAMSLVAPLAKEQDFMNATAFFGQQSSIGLGAIPTGIIPQIQQFQHTPQ